MTPTKREEILTEYYRLEGYYDALADEICRLFNHRRDDSVPKESIYTITRRIKEPDRMFQKLDHAANKSSRSQPIDRCNFREEVTDLLGIRVVCLRRSDVGTVERFLDALHEEQKLKFVEGPDRKESFIFDDKAKDFNLQESGYSSVHYLVSLGDALSPSAQLKDLLAEIQVRTILEEAWAEIEHKYQYEKTRIGNEPKKHIQQGFLSLSAYLKAAALQVEHLCEQAGVYGSEEELDSPEASEPNSKADQDQSSLADPTYSPDTRDGSSSESPSRLEKPHHGRVEVEDVIEDRVGFRPPERLAAYVKKRLNDHGFDYDTRASDLGNRVLSHANLQDFKAVFRATLGFSAFELEEERDLDLIYAVNYGLMRDLHGDSTARVGLSARLRTRESQSRGLLRSETAARPGRW